MTEEALMSSAGLPDGQAEQLRDEAVGRCVELIGTLARLERSLVDTPPPLNPFAGEGDAGTWVRPAGGGGVVRRAET